MLTDQIADMLTRIRNAYRAHLETVAMPHSKLKQAIADILVRENYLSGAERRTGAMTELVLTLKYQGRTPVVTDIKRVSKPGHRVYCRATEVPKVLNGLGISIISTSQGVMTNKEAAAKNLGGEVICSVY